MDTNTDIRITLTATHITRMYFILRNIFADIFDILLAANILRKMMKQSVS